MKGRIFLCVFLSCTIYRVATASQDTVGIDGILSAGLLDFNENMLNGNGSVIGQVEGDRPGIPNFDTLANSSPSIVPAGIFLRDGTIGANTDIDTHPQWVAGVMISKDPCKSRNNWRRTTGISFCLCV